MEQRAASVGGTLQVGGGVVGGCRRRRVHLLIGANDATPKFRMTHVAVREEPLPPAAGRRPGLGAWGVAVAWLALMVWVGRSGLLRTWGGFGPLSALQVSILLPIVLALVAARFSRGFVEWAESLDPVFLTALQAVRILGTSHLFTLGYGLMAGGFAIPVGLGNLAVALLALYTVPLVATRAPNWRARVRLLTWLGLAEFGMTIVLAILGFLAVASPLDPPMLGERYASVARLPLSLFPTYLIPLFSVVHIITLVRLRKS
jgi:hypothetical protein